MFHVGKLVAHGAYRLVSAVFLLQNGSIHIEDSCSPVDGWVYFTSGCD